MRLSKLTCILIFLSSILSGCQTWNYIVKEEPAPVPDSSAKFIIPVGWTHAVVVNDRLMISKDGFGIQFIEVIEGESKKVFENTEVKFEENAIPEDAAKSVISFVKESAGFVNVDVVENTPTKLGGKDAFRLHLSFRNEKGVRFERIIYGLVHKKKLLMVSYQAATLHYFKRDLPVFERAVQTITL